MGVGEWCDEVPDPSGELFTLRRGDPVIVLPSAPGKRDGFPATFRRGLLDHDTLIEVEVFGGRAGRGAIRTFRPERVKRQDRRRR